jgi:hypothetical protein
MGADLACHQHIRQETSGPKKCVFPFATAVAPRGYDPQNLFRLNANIKPA